MGKKYAKKLTKMEEVKSLKKFTYEMDGKKHIIRKQLLSKKGRDLGLKKVYEIEEISDGKYIILFKLCRDEMEISPRLVCKKINFYYWEGELYAEVYMLDGNIFLYDGKYHQVKEEVFS